MSCVHDFLALVFAWQGGVTLRGDCEDGGRDSPVDVVTHERSTFVHWYVRNLAHGMLSTLQHVSV